MLAAVQSAGVANAIIAAMILRALKAAVVVACVGLGGCSPALDWREVRPSGTSLRALLPCKSVVQQRQVRLAGQNVLLSLHACTAGGRTWGLAHADVVDPKLLRAALDEWRAAAVNNIGAASPKVLPLQVPGATPHEASARVVLAGARPDGQAVEMQLAVFAHGTRVFQATVLGPLATGEDAANFFSNLRLAP